MEQTPTTPIAVKQFEYEKFGCTKCGNKFAYWRIQGAGYALGNCVACNEALIIVSNSSWSCPLKIEDQPIPVVSHPRATVANEPASTPPTGIDFVKGLPSLKQVRNAGEKYPYGAKASSISTWQQRFKSGSGVWSAQTVRMFIACKEDGEYVHVVGAHYDDSEYRLCRSDNLEPVPWSEIDG